MKRIVSLFMSVTLLLLTACSQEPTNNKSDYTAFLSLLNANEFQYTEAEVDNDSFLAVPRKPVLIGDEIISIYEYASNEHMEEDSQYIDKGGCSISVPGKSVEISWISFPHFYKKDTLIIQYIGEDEQILGFLNENYGAEFAGYRFSSAFEMLTATQNDQHIEAMPIDYNSLQFQDFTATEASLEGQNYSGYEELILQVKDVLENFDGNYPEKEPFSSVFYQHWDYETLGYLIKDIDGNGVDDLIFGANTNGWDNGSWDGVIYDLYTIVNGEVFHVLDGWERNRYYLCENGCIANEGSNSAFESSYRYYTYSGAELTLTEAVVHNSMQDEENPWFYSAEDEHDIENAEPISQEKAEEIMNKYVHEHPQYTSFVEK